MSERIRERENGLERDQRVEGSMNMGRGVDRKTQCVCVCVRERERERDMKRERVRETERD